MIVEDAIQSSSLNVSAVVREFGWLQLELLLATILIQRCILPPGKVASIPQHLEWSDVSRLRSNVIALIGQWFENEFLSRILARCVDPEPRRRPGLSELERYFRNNLIDGSSENKKNQITAVIHGDGILSL